MYRFLATPRWLGLAFLTCLLAVGMVFLGNWQLERFHARAAINDQTAAALRAPLVPVGELSVPGRRPAAAVGWRQVSATGEYDPSQVILARARTYQQRVGFEVLVPLRLADGSAVLVDRGWVPPAESGMSARPPYPTVPSGQVTVIGRLRLPESSPGPISRAGDGVVEVRRVDPVLLGRQLPYPVLGGWLSVDEAEQGFRTVAADPGQQPAWMNAAYVIQWWLFAAMTPFGYFWLARKEALVLREAQRVEGAVVPTGTATPEGASAAPRRG